MKCAKGIAGLLLVLLLTACGSEPQQEPSVVDPAPQQTQQEQQTPPPVDPQPTVQPVDLSGAWRQVDAVETETYQFALVEDGKIDIYWNMPDSGVMLYWVGTCQTQTDGTEPFSFDSANDTSRTSGALFASSDATKTLTYKDGRISYSAAFMGLETVVELEPYSGELPDATAASGPQQSEGVLGDYAVKITGYRLAKDYEGKDVIIIQYDFTNNGADAESAMFALTMTAFQDGIQLETAFMLDDSYQGDNSSKDIKPGVTISCESAYELPNTTSPVEFEVSELFSFDSTSVVETFNIAE